MLYFTIPGVGPVGNPPGYGTGTGNLSSLGSIITSLMPYVFTIAGLILLFMIVSAGFTLLTSAGNPEAIEKGKSRLTAGLIGFLLVFAAYWIVQIIVTLLSAYRVLT